MDGAPGMVHAVHFFGADDAVVALGLGVGDGGADRRRGKSIAVGLYVHGEKADFSASWTRNGQFMWFSDRGRGREGESVPLDESEKQVGC